MTKPDYNEPIQHWEPTKVGKHAIYEQEWWPVYAIYPTDPGETPDSFTAEELADYDATMQAFDRWQNILYNRYTGAPEPPDMQAAPTIEPRP